MCVEAIFSIGSVSADRTWAWWAPLIVVLNPHKAGSSLSYVALWRTLWFQTGGHIFCGNMRSLIGESCLHIFGFAAFFYCFIFGKYFQHWNVLVWSIFLCCCFDQNWIKITMQVLISPGCFIYVLMLLINNLRCFWLPNNPLSSSNAET